MALSKQQSHQSVIRGTQQLVVILKEADNLTN